MAFVAYSINCCGIRELADIQPDYYNPEDACDDPDCHHCHCTAGEFTRKALEQNAIRCLEAALAELCGEAYLFFSDNNAGRRHAVGKALAAAIRKWRLGSVTTMAPKKNANSGNMLQVWLWALDVEKLHNKPWLPKAKKP